MRSGTACENLHFSFYVCPMYGIHSMLFNVFTLFAMCMSCLFEHLSALVCSSICLLCVCLVCSSICLFCHKTRKML